MGSYIPSTAEERQQMLHAIGLSRVEELYADVPPDVLLKQPLHLPDGLSELEVRAAMEHLAAQNRAWHFGSDGSSPLDRARRAGYSGHLVGENISESYENDIATLQAWMQERDTRDVIMDPSATTLGVAWYQEPSRKIWWTLVTGK